MHRTFKIVALTAALAAIGGTASAQDFTVGFHPRTGDVWIDTTLGDMNRYGTRYRDPFVDEMVRYHGAPRDLVSDLLGNRRWAPGDVYMACSIASIIGRPCRYVVDEYERDPGQGWGNIAKRMGIKPGSPEFHRLKNGFVPTYDRWSRPIVLDSDLQRAYPNHGNGKGKSDHGNGNGNHGNSGKSGEHGNSGHGNGNGNGHGNGNKGGGHGKGKG
ncbi:hypothetical protein LYSHEL_09560 [Lysobacter helvus]|uniref:Uncharacterized protein n=2 Tax=Lysobacteraceae TaxID=32033 RepID=A0ABM7Q3V3_9GAMM|nr:MULTISPECIES: hypothetical protein [Lysobacter]BCT91932.1 hypothetical protein LYSCAS_09560 [Lysobacter caseinilyticus]BCT95085.1 hypothetical protein LYSHEL_09560 [Lysobacter helvus]